MLCQFCGDDHNATHEVWTGKEWLPACESYAEDMPPQYVRPITYRRCVLCPRAIERTWPAYPLCDLCQRTGQAHARLARAEREWIADGRPR